MSEKKQQNTPKLKTMIGGQAIIEGIMMRGPDKVAMVVRAPEGLVCDEKPLNLPKDKHPILGWPVIRGVVNFVDAMRLGTKALAWSAEHYPLDEEEEKTSKDDTSKTEADAMPTPSQSEAPDAEAVASPQTKTEEAPPSEPTPSSDVPAPTKDKDSDAGFAQKALIAVSMVFGIVLAVGIFMLLPAYLSSLFDTIIPKGVWRSLIEGGIRLVILLLYMILVSLMKDIRRVFSYHGAEHKSIACYEDGAELTVENVRRYSRFHPRCGTSFLFTVVIISILVFSLAFPLENVWLRLASRLLLLPVVVALSYEVNRLIGKYDNWFTKLLRRPGMWMQYITTNEPDDSMIEVGILALKKVLPAEAGTDVWGKNN